MSWPLTPEDHPWRCPLLTARTAERFRAEIRAYFGFREATVADADALLVWLRDHAAPEAAGDLDVLVERLETRCREQALKPPAPDRIERIVRAAQRAHLDRFHTAVYERLSPAAHGRLDELLLPEIDEGEQSGSVAKFGARVVNCVRRLERGVGLLRP